MPPRGPGESQRCSLRRSRFGQELRVDLGVIAPQSSRSSREISPTVQRARRASRIAGRRFSSRPCGPSHLGKEPDRPPLDRARRERVPFARAGEPRSRRSTWRLDPVRDVLREAVHPDDDSLARLDLTLVAERGCLDLRLHPTLFDRGDGAADRRSSRSAPCPLLEVAGERLDEVGPARGPAIPWPQPRSRGAAGFGGRSRRHARWVAQAPRRTSSCGGTARHRRRRRVPGSPPARC